MTKTNKKQKAGDQKPAFSKMNDFKKEAAFHIFKESITTAFLLYMFVVFPLVLHDGYMDITITKYNFFKNGVLIYGILMCLTFILGFTDHMEEHTDAAKKTGRGRNFLASDIWMGAFVLSGTLAWIMADDKMAAYTGSMGRRCGLEFLVLVLVLYIGIGSGYKWQQILAPVFSVISGLAFLMGSLQHLDIDVFHLLSHIREDQQAMFLSTFGNINIFAGFVCTSVAFFSGMYLIEEKRAFRICYMAALLLGGAALIAANSDSAYMGLAAAWVILLFFSLKRSLFAEFVTVCTTFLSGYTIMAWITTGTGRGYEKLSGLAKLVDVREILTVCCVIGILCAIWLSKKKYNTGRSALSRLFIAGILLIAGITVTVIGCTNHWEIFVFDDFWGDYRGFIWSRLCRIYQDLPFVDQVFGNGNESIYALMSARYYDEMLTVTGTVYDSAHNEYLQYLVTMGAFGLITYVGLIITSIRNCVKTWKDEPVMLAILMLIVSYITQAFVNVEQPITTPFLFLFVAIAAGIRRNSLKKDGSRTKK